MTTAPHNRPAARFAALAATLALAAAAPARAEVVLEAGFAPGPWLERFNAFVPAPWADGLERASVVEDEERGRTVLKVLYPEGAYGTADTGTVWRTYLGRHRERATLTFDVKFGADFDFVKGGKLPGLVGGQQKGKPHSTASGGYRPDGTDAWSARVHWQADGRIIQYVYHPRQPGHFGEALPWILDGAPARFVPGRWYRVTVETTMNHVGAQDGRIRAWLDGRLALDRGGFEFRTVPELAIDSLVFSTFFGGDDDSFATTKTESAFFDRFVVQE